MWLKILKAKTERDETKASIVKQSNKETSTNSMELITSDHYIPGWFENYIEYKFNLYDRAGMQYVIYGAI